MAIAMVKARSVMRNCASIRKCYTGFEMQQLTAKRPIHTVLISNPPVSALPRIIAC